MSKEILRPQKAQPAPVPLAHIVGEIDHMGKVWTPAAQQEPVACMVQHDEYGVMVWRLKNINEARRYCKENEFPVLLYTKEKNT
jgi:hypothetical protein